MKRYRVFNFDYESRAFTGMFSSKRRQQIEKKPEISRKELAYILGINPSAVQKHIHGLKDKGYIRRIGPDKGGHWEVIGK